MHHRTPKTELEFTAYLSGVQGALKTRSGPVNLIVMLSLRIIVLSLINIMLLVIQY